MNAEWGRCGCPWALGVRNLVKRSVQTTCLQRLRRSLVESRDDVDFEVKIVSHDVDRARAECKVKGDLPLPQSEYTC